MKPSSLLDPAVARECRVFTRYLARGLPSEYVLSCYGRLLASAREPGALAPPLIDRVLLGFARLGGPATRIADAYATRLRPYGPLRRRLILLLAILENAPPTAEPLNAARRGPVLGAGLGIAAALASSAGALLLGLVLLGPLHLLSPLFGNGR